MSRRRLGGSMYRSSLVLACLALGCAHAPPPVAIAPAAKRLPPPPAQRDVSGVWEWVFRSNDQQGDLRVEQEEWHLAQHGKALEGWYDRAVTVMSTDERLFRCNQKMGFTKFTRVQIAGSIEGDTVEIHETSYQAPPNACDDGARSLVAYRGLAQEGVIHLMWDANAGQTLHKRDVARGPRLAELVGIDEAALEGTPGVERGPQASVPVSGTWEWEQKTVDADGDERVEHEVWQLEETADGISGHYDLEVKMMRGEGLFPCNHADHYETRTRFDVRGTRIGDRLSLVETGFTVAPVESDATAGRKSCDNGRRRLDTYQGSLSGDGDELILSWGPGYQLLHRHAVTASH